MEVGTVEVRKSRLKAAGAGLFASKDLPKGTYVVDYRGSLVSREQLAKHGYNRDYTLLSGPRYVDSRDPQGRLVMDDGRALNVHRFGQRDWDRLRGRGIEWKGEASLGRFVNHGPREARNVSFRSHPRFGMGFVTTRAVRSGEELLTNYGPDYWKLINSDTCFKCGLEGFLIQCDVPHCRRSYHIPCARIRKIPKGSWRCPVCAAAAHPLAARAPFPKRLVEKDERYIPLQTSSSRA